MLDNVLYTVSIANRIHSRVWRVCYSLVCIIYTKFYYFTPFTPIWS